MHTEPFPLPWTPPQPTPTRWWTFSIDVTPSSDSSSSSRCCPSSSSISSDSRSSSSDIIIRQQRWRRRLLSSYDARRLNLPSRGARFHVVRCAQYRRVEVEPQLAGQYQLRDAAHDTGRVPLAGVEGGCRQATCGRKLNALKFKLVKCWFWRGRVWGWI